MGFFDMVGGGVQASTQMVPAAIAAFPTKMERSYRRRLESETQRLANGGGGMTSSQRSSMSAQAHGEAEAQKEAQMAAVGRGSARGVQSGSQQLALRGTQQIAQQGRASVDSQVRDADLRLATAQRAQLEKSNIYAMQMGQARKAQFLNAMGNSGLTKQAGTQAGQEYRVQHAEDVDAATKQVTAETAETTAARQAAEQAARAAAAAKAAGALVGVPS